MILYNVQLLLISLNDKYKRKMMSINNTCWIFNLQFLKQYLFSLRDIYLKFVVCYIFHLNSSLSSLIYPFYKHSFILSVLCRQIIVMFDICMIRYRYIGFIVIWFFLIVINLSSLVNSTLFSMWVLHYWHAHFREPLIKECH